MLRTLTALVATATVLTGPVAAQRREPEFLWLSPSMWSVSRRALLRDLQAAADRGYRLAPLPPAGLLLLVQKSADPDPIEYAFAWSGKELDANAAIGYRLIANFVMARSRRATTRTYEYREIGTRRRQSMENELRDAVAQGFRVVSLTLRNVVGVRSFVNGIDDAEFVALLERPVDGSSTTRPEYIVLSTVRAATMQTELQAAADRGFRLPSLGGTWGATALLEKIADADPVEYLVLSAAKTDTMQAEMRQAAESGYRFATTLGSGDRESVVVMQRRKGLQARTHEQALVGALRVGTMKRESLALLDRGFRVVGVTTSGLQRESVLILERPVQ